MTNEPRYKSKGQPPQVESEIFDCLSQQLQEWEADGINVESVRKNLELPVADVIAAFDDFGAALTELTELRQIVKLYTGLGADDILAQVEPLLSNPIHIPEIKVKLNAAEERIDFIQLKHKEFERMIEDWDWAQVEVGPLREVLASEADLDVISQKFMEFEERYYGMLALRERLTEFDFTGREDKLESIFFMLSDPMNLEKVEQKIRELE